MEWGGGWGLEECEVGRAKFLGNRVNSRRHNRVEGEGSKGRAGEGNHLVKEGSSTVDGDTVGVRNRVRMT